MKDIIINEDMTGEYKKYEYYIDEENKVHIGEKANNPITVSADASYVGTSSTTIKVEANSIKGNIIKYQYKINNEKTEESTQNEYTIENLEPDTKYEILVIAIDEKGNSKSAIPITITTKERTYIIKDGKQQIRWRSNKC